MVLKLGTSSVGQRVPVPWETIDPQDSLQVSAGEREIAEKAGADGTRYAMVELEGRWETVAEDRMPLTDAYFK